MSLPPSFRLALVDDHILFRKGLISLIEMVLPDSEIVFEADNGLDLRKKLLHTENPPDIILLDINMRGMDGFAVVEWLTNHYPLVRVLVVSMITTEDIIVSMVKLGVKGYICKDVEPQELAAALRAIMNRGYYYTDFTTGKLGHTLQNGNDSRSGNGYMIRLNDRERDFIQLACSEKTYNEIAAEMYLSPKTIDGYRNALFEKLNVKSRVGLAMYAVKHGLVRL